MDVLVAVASWSAQLPPARPHLTVPEPTDVVVAQFTTASRLTRSVRYGYRRSEPENAASAPAAVTAAVALTARRTTRGKNRDRNIDSHDARGCFEYALLRRIDASRSGRANL